MSSTSSLERCHACGAALMTDGVCPACMLEHGLFEEDRKTSGIAPPSTPPVSADYELLEEIARGGMGVVYKARQKSLNRIVAVKMILSGRLAGSSDLKRFQAEAELAAQLQHPNIAVIHEVGDYEGQPFYSMDYVEGNSLAELARNEPMPPRRAAGYLKSIAEAVEYAHSKGVLHRDLKPSNVLIDQNDQPRITDFGLAKRFDDSERSSLHSSLTLTGQVLGSPNFMPPEQATGRRQAICPTSDVYSLGAILYQLLTGRPPFLAETLPQTLRLVAETEPVSPRLLIPTVPRDLETICLKCLEKSPARRYGSAGALAQEFGRFLRDVPIEARPVGKAEKMWRWCRRNRALATAGGAAAMLLLMLAIGSPIALVRIDRARRGEQENAQKAQRQRQIAQENATRAENLAEANRWSLYAARIKLAEEAIQKGDILRARQMLDSLRPRPGQPDLRGFDWFHLWHQYHGERLALAGAPSIGRTLAFSPDGRWLAAVAKGDVIRVHDLTNGVERFRLTGHTGWVHHLAFCPTDGTLASAGEDGTVRLWDVVNGKQTRLFRLGTNSFSTVAFSADGRLLAAGEGTRIPHGGSPSERYSPQARTGRVAVWDLEDNHLIWTVPAHRVGVLDLAFRPDRPWLASSGADGRSTVIDCKSGQILATRTNASGQAFGVAFLPGGREIVEGRWLAHADSGEINILDADTLQMNRRLVSRAGRILCLAVSPDGSMIASAGADGLARAWKTADGTEQRTLPGHIGPILALAFAPDGNAIATAGADAIKLWDLHGTAVRQDIRTQNSFSVAFSPDGNLLACGGKSVEIRDAASGQLLRTLGEPTNYDMMVTFSPDGRFLRASRWNSETNSFWSTADWTPLPAPEPGFMFGGLFEPSPDNHSFATCEDDKAIRFRDMKTGTVLNMLTNLPEAPAIMGFVRDGTFLSGAEHWSFWDTAARRVLRTEPGIPGLVRLSSDGRWLALCQFQGRVNLYELPELKFRAGLAGHHDRTWEYAFSNDSRLLATGSWDGTVKLWHVLSGQELLSIPSNAGVVWSVAFAPGDRALAFGCGQTAPDTGMVVLLRAAPMHITDSAVQALEIGQSLGREGRWQGAADAFKQVIEQRPDLQAGYYYLALVYAVAGDVSSYRRLCQKIQSLFPDIEFATDAERAARVCLLLPEKPADSKLTQRWVETANRVDRGDKLVAAYADHVAGLHAYRQQDYAQALARMELVRHQPSSGPALLVGSWMVSAMVHLAQQEPEKARADLATGLELERTRLPRTEGGDLWESWPDWIMSHVLVAEARALINPAMAGAGYPKSVEK